VPAEALQEIAAFVHKGSLEYTRIDVAIDYNAALGTCSCTHDSLRKVATYGNGADLTGWTFGSRKGARYTRVYDKRREREEKGFEDDELLQEIDGPLWRVEVENRPHGADPLPETLFDGLHLRDLMPEKMGWREEAIIRCCLDDPTFLRKIPTADGTRKRYRERLAELTAEVTPMPEVVYRECREWLLFCLWEIGLLISGGDIAEGSPGGEDPATHCEGGIGEDSPQRAVYSQDVLTV